MFKFFLIASLIGYAAAVGPSDEYHAETTLLKSDVRHDGFDYALETTNHIHHVASGNIYGKMQGEFSWISPEGQHILVKYIADENGYQPVSDVLPTPHPIPEAILKAIAYIQAHPPKEEYHHH